MNIHYNRFIVSNGWKLLAIFYNLLQYLAIFDNFWQLCHFLQLLATFVILLSCHPVTLSSYHLIILSSLHPVILSFCHLLQSTSLSICQPVNLLACELLSV